MLGGVIMYGALLFFEDEFINIISISFTALILTELIMVALSVETWHSIMMMAEIVSLFFYLLTVIICYDYFGKFFRHLFSSIVSQKSPFWRKHFVR